MIKRFVNKIRKRVGLIKVGALTSIRKLIKKSDYKRWSDSGSLKSSWDSRTAQIALLVPPHSNVIEFGAGRMVLKGFLPTGCIYVPSDLVDRGPGTIICDLNGDMLPSFGSYDVAVFSGVLEYINDLPRLISHLSVKTVISSYAVYEVHPNNRRTQGWVNDFTTEEFIEVFERCGFFCDKIEQWESQKIFKFVKDNS